MYYEQRYFDLALKYYEMAAEYNNLYAISELGYHPPRGCFGS